MQSESDKLVKKAVRWNKIPLKTNIYAVRDQPTWKNCKFQRPPEVKSDSRPFLPRTDRETPSRLTPTSIYYQRSLTPKSGSTARTVTSTGRVSSSSAESTNSNCLTLQDVVSNKTINNKLQEKGRDIIKRKVKEQLAPVCLNRYENFKSPPSSTKRSESRSFKKFRIASAESGHRSPDVSIGLKHILTVVRSFAEPKFIHNGERRRSETLLTTLVNVTSKNLNATRRQSYPPVSSSYPPVSSSEVQNYDNFPRVPAPGEGHLQRRRSSVSAPATRGTDSNSYPGTTKRIPRTPKRKRLPETTVNSPYVDREWRPTNLQKYSLSSPWAPAQQTGRYFPNFCNLQDVHCRNPYLVPGSFLYKEHIALK